MYGSWVRIPAESPQKRTFESATVPATAAFPLHFFIFRYGTPFVATRRGFEARSQIHGRGWLLGLSSIPGPATAYAAHGSFFDAGL